MVDLLRYQADHLDFCCVSTTVYLDLVLLCIRIRRCVSAVVYPPLCIRRCVSADVYPPLCICHCVSAAVYLPPSIRRCVYRAVYLELRLYIRRCEYVS
jgi:hypothetical protein